MTFSARALAACLVLAGTGAAVAQPTGSVLCNYNMRRADNAMAAIDRRLTSIRQQDDVEETCRIWKLAVEVRRLAGETYQKCRAEERHYDRLYEIDSSADELEKQIVQHCQS